MHAKGRLEELPELDPPVVHDFTRKDFLEALFSDYYRDNKGFILIRTSGRNDGKPASRYFPNTRLPANENYGEDLNVYVGVTPRERAKPGKENIKYLVALWASVEVGMPGNGSEQAAHPRNQEAIIAIKKFPRAPSIVVDSGRAVHLYWLLKQPTEVLDVEQVEQTLADIATHFPSSSAPSLDTVLRLPDTVNPEVEQQHCMCQIRYINSSTRYELEDFRNLEEVKQAALTPQALRKTHQEEPSEPAEAQIVVSSAHEVVPIADQEVIVDSGSVEVEIYEPPLEEPVQRHEEHRASPPLGESVFDDLVNEISAREPTDQPAETTAVDTPPRRPEVQKAKPLAADLVDESVVHDLVDEISGKSPSEENDERSREKPETEKRKPRRGRNLAAALVDESVVDDLVDEISGESLPQENDEDSQEKPETESRKQRSKRDVAAALVDESVADDLVDEISGESPSEENDESSQEKPETVKLKPRKKRNLAAALVDESVADDLVDDISMTGDSSGD